jgi:tetratricopeptide (TPR) repeat protein
MHSVSIDATNAVQPETFSALVRVALALQRSGRWNEARASYECALRVDGSNPEAWYNYGCVLIAVEAHLDATSALERAIALRADDPDFFDAAAFAYRKLNRHARSIAHLLRSLALTGNPRVRIRLAESYVALGRYAEAQPHALEALAQLPKAAEAHESLGIVHYYFGRREAASASFRAALACDPESPSAVTNLGTVSLESGDTSEAARCFKRAIELNPDDGRSYLALVKTTSGRIEPAHLAAMSRLAESGGGVDAEQRSALHFALGGALEREGRVDEAFRHLCIGNALKRATVRYDEPRTLAHLQLLQRLYAHPRLRRWRGGGDPSERPIFIFGMPRSGTTLVEQLLVAHPDVAGDGEVRLLAGIAGTRLPSLLAASSTDAGALLRLLGERYLRATDGLAATARRFTDKTLDNFQLAPMINLALPNARMIHVRRDPVDTCFSAFATLFEDDHVPFSYDLGELGRYHRAYSRMMNLWGEVIPADRMLEVRYEDLIGNFEGESRRILAFCDIPWDPACLAFHTAPRPVRTASSFQVRQPIYRTAIARSAPFGHHLGTLRENL